MASLWREFRSVEVQTLEHQFWIMVPVVSAPAKFASVRSASVNIARLTSASTNEAPVSTLEVHKSQVGS